MQEEKIDTDEQQIAGTFAEKMAAVKAVALRVFNFVKKHWVIFTISFMVVFVVVDIS